MRTLLRTTSSSELTEQMALYRLEPFGAEIMDAMFAQLCSVVANCHRAKNQRAFKPEDFLLLRDRRRPTLEQQIALARSLHESFVSQGKVGKPKK